MAIRIRKRADTLLISSLFCALRVFLAFYLSDENEIPIVTVWHVYRWDHTYINGRKLVIRICEHSGTKRIPFNLLKNAILKVWFDRITSIVFPRCRLVWYKTNSVTNLFYIFDIRRKFAKFFCHTKGTCQNIIQIIDWCNIRLARKLSERFKVFDATCKYLQRLTYAYCRKSTLSRN